MLKSDSDDFIALLIGLIAGLLAGSVVGAALNTAAWREESVKRGFARYNPTTAEWHWVDQAPMNLEAENATEKGGER